MISTKESVKLPGGGSSPPPNNIDHKQFSAECSSAGPLALEPSVDAADPTLNQGGCSGGSVAVHVPLNLPVTVPEQVPREIGVAIAVNTAVALPIVTDDETVATRSTLDVERAEEAHEVSLRESTDILTFAKQVEQEALREMEEAMQLVRVATKRRLEGAATQNAYGGHCSRGSNETLKAILPTDSLGVPPLGPIGAATTEFRAVNPDLQRPSRHPQQHKNWPNTPAGRAHNDVCISKNARERRHTVVLDSSQVGSGPVSCPFTSLCFSTSNMCDQEEIIPEPRASRLKSVAI